MEGECFEIGRGEVALAAERWGTGGPRALLLHAGVCDRRSWREVAARLAEEGIPAAAYDRRGFGGSRLDADPPSDLDDLVAVLDSLDADPIWLVGASMGGGLALDAALTVPERIAGMVLIAPAIGGASEPPNDEFDEGTLRIDRLLSEASEEEDLDRVNELEIELWLDGPAGPAGRVGGEARALALAMNAIALSSEAEGIPAEGVDADSRIEEIDLPVTVAWGELDIPRMIDVWRGLAERLPRAGDPQELAGVAHLPFLERPAEVAALIAAAVAAGGRGT